MCDEIMKPQSQADNENVLYSSFQFIYNVYNPATWSTETVPVQLNVWHKDSACPMHGLMYGYGLGNQESREQQLSMMWMCA
jgi:hypothetical protein